jgi:serine/threonine-protein kinase HipA
MMSGSNLCLEVILAKEKIATVTLMNDQLLWQYTQAWQQSGYAVSPNLPLQTEIPSLNTQRFLRNFLPEGPPLEELVACFHVSKSNTFGLIRALGLDLPGALMVLSPEHKIEKTPIFRVITNNELTQRLNDRAHFSLIVWDGKPRLSVAGVQDKINVILKKDGQLGFGEGSLCSTHILKFEKQKLSHLVLNEYITMQLAKHCGIKVAKVEIMSFGDNPALMIKRFDRQWISANRIKRLHVIDGCQALNLSPEYKYERNFGSGRDVRHIRDGVSYAKLFDFAMQCINPVSTRNRLLDWALFNVLVFNYDAHGKNISFFVGEEGISLAPFYDLVNIKMYPDFEQEMAMAFGDEFDGNVINAYQLADFADICGLSRALVTMRLKSLIKKLNDALDNKLKIVFKNKEESDYFKRYQKIIHERAKHLSSQITAIRKIEL